MKMSIRFTAKGLYINGELMTDYHSNYNISQHIKYVLFGGESK